MVATKPVILVVDEGAQSLAFVEQELKSRYAAHYQIVAEARPSTALEKLKELKEAGIEVAILLADCWMPGMTGADFLQQAHELYPQAKRGLLVEWNDERGGRLMIDAMSLNVIDAYNAKPLSSPDEEFHQFIGQFLAEWTKEQGAQFEILRLVGEQWSRRAHELRDLLNRNGIQFGFYEVNSETGQALLEETNTRGAPLPVVIRYDGLALTNPTNAQVAEALGARTIYEPEAGPGKREADVVVVGAGPAGLSAAVNGASEGLRVVIEP